MEVLEELDRLKNKLPPKEEQSIDWLAMMKEELGTTWLHADLFRFGASGMLADIERQLEHYVTGRYSAEHRHPIA